MHLLFFRTLPKGLCPVCRVGQRRITCLCNISLLQLQLSMLLSLALPGVTHKEEQQNNYFAVRRMMLDASCPNERKKEIIVEKGTLLVFLCTGDPHYVPYTLLLIS